MKKKVIMSRDVIFYENIFPFQKTQFNDHFEFPVMPKIPIDADIEVPSNSHTSQIPDLPFDSSQNQNFIPVENEFLPNHEYDPDHIDLEQHEEVPNFLHQQDNMESQNNIRRSKRATRNPAWHRDYIMHCLEGSSPHTPPTFPYVESEKLTSCHESFLTSVSLIKEPSSYDEACENVEWIKAMQTELKALEDYETWTIVPLPPNKKPIGSKWVYKVKMYPDGTVERFKARLVAKGYNQVYGIDYVDSFSPVAKIVTVRILLSLSTSNDWPLHQLDINNAFLHGFLDEEVYLTPPQGYSKAKEGQVCKLNKSLYRLKQASRQWHLEFCNKIIEFGFKQSQHDHCLFVKGEGEEFIALVVYVDDVLITGPKLEKIDEVKEYLHKAFTIKDLGQASYFLGVELLKTNNGLYVNQRKYVLDILGDAGLSGVKPACTPSAKNAQLCSDKGALLQDP